MHFEKACEFLKCINQNLSLALLYLLIDRLRADSQTETFYFKEVIFAVTWSVCRLEEVISSVFIHIDEIFFKHANFSVFWLFQKCR